MCLDRKYGNNIGGERAQYENNQSGPVLHYVNTINTAGTNISIYIYIICSFKDDGGEHFYLIIQK